MSSPAGDPVWGGVVGASLLRVEELHVWFDLAGGGELHAVQGVSFELSAGDRFGLVGEKHLRLAREGHGDRGPLAHPAG